MIIDLSGKTALVTGATGGIGLAIASGLAAADAEEHIVGRTRERVDAAVRQAASDAGRDTVHGVVADAGTAAGCDAVIAALPDAAAVRHPGRGRQPVCLCGLATGQRDHGCVAAGRGRHRRGHRLKPVAQTQPAEPATPPSQFQHPAVMLAP